MKTKIIIILITGMLFGSCCVDHLHSSNTSGYDSPVKARKVEVYSTEQTDKPYSIIGDAEASVVVMGKGSSSVKHLKKEAAALGADGIINLRLEIGSGVLANAVTASGTAVKFEESHNN